LASGDDRSRLLVSFVVIKDNGQREIEVELSEKFRISPEIAAALRSARGHLRKVIGDQVRMKVLPDLEFEEDESVETADRIEQLLQQVRPPDEESG